jgi:hypothetical protein
MLCTVWFEIQSDSDIAHPDVEPPSATKKVGKLKVPVLHSFYLSLPSIRGGTIDWGTALQDSGYRVFPGAKAAGRGVALNTHLYLAPRLKKE